MIAQGELRAAPPVTTIPLRALPYESIPPHAQLPSFGRVDIVAKSELLGLPAGWYLIAPKNSAARGWVPVGSVILWPILGIDCAHQDHGQKPNFGAVYAAGWNVCGIKMTEGTDYAFEAWGKTNAPRVRAAAGDLFGDTAYRARYHYGLVFMDAIGQVHYFLDSCADSGWGPGDVLPVCDVERGENGRVTDPKVVRKWMEAFIAEIDKELHCRTIIYGGEYLRAMKIRPVQDCGAAGGWFAEYAHQLDPKVWQELGLTSSPETRYGWQYAGDKASYAVDPVNHQTLPYEIPDFGHGDSTYCYAPDFYSFRTAWCYHVAT